jgi:hypothetical protein
MRDNFRQRKFIFMECINFKGTWFNRAGSAERIFCGRTGSWATAKLQLHSNVMFKEENRVPAGFLAAYTPISEGQLSSGG